MAPRTNIDCLRCGKCCLVHMIAYVTEDDIIRWRARGRRDILERLDRDLPVWAGDRMISSIDGREILVCPFLGHDGGRSWCTIYDARPEVCRNYLPGSSELCPLYRK